MKTSVHPGVTIGEASNATAGRSKNWPVYLAVAVVTSVVYGIIFQVWNADPGVPPWYADHGDSIQELATTKCFFDVGNFYGSPLISAPLGGATYEFPIFSAAQLPAQFLLNVLTRNVFFALSLLYFLAHPAGAVAAYFAMRRLDIRPWVAFAPAVLFALVPHFLFGEGFGDEPLYWIIPLSSLMCILIARGNLRILERRNGRRAITRDGWIVLGAAALTGAGQVYYAFFAVILLGTATVIAALKMRSARPIVLSALLTAIVCIGLGLQVAPALVYKFEHGRNAQAFVRTPEAAQVYGLQIAQVLLPVENHRGPAWIAAKRTYYDSRAPFAQTESQYASLGAIGAIGFLALLGALLARSAATLPYDVEAISLLNLAAVMLATIAGFGALFSFFVSPDIRGFNRISLFLEFFALAGLGQMLMFAGSRMPARFTVAARFVLVCAAILFGAWDQSTPGVIPPYAASASEFRSDETFVREIEAHVGSGAAFELPWMRYPEAPAIGGVAQGDLFRPYLHATTLRTSYGAVEGRDPYEWQRSVATLALSNLIPSIVAGGFDGLIIFRLGYPDNGATLEADLRKVLGPPIVSANGDLAFYSAKALRARMIAADPAIGTPLYPQRVVRWIGPAYGPMFWYDPRQAVPTWRSGAGSAYLTLRNDGSWTRPVELRGAISFGGGRGRLRVDGPAGPVTLEAGARPAPLRYRFDARPGKTTIRFVSDAALTTAGNDPRPFAFELADPRLTILDKPELSAAAQAVAFDAVAPIAAVDSFGGRRIRLLQGCLALETSPGRSWNWCDRAGTLRIESNRRERLRFTATVATPGTPTAQLQLDVGGVRQSIAVLPAGTRIALDVNVAPQHPALISFSTNAARLQSTDPRSLVLTLYDPQLK